MNLPCARIRRAILGIGLCIALTACQGQADDALARDYLSFLKINQLKSSFYTEPKTGEKYPLVEGSLSNLGGKTLIVVEFTLRFKNSVQHVIYQEQAYPVFVSEFSRLSTQEALKPGTKTRFRYLVRHLLSTVRVYTMLFCQALSQGNHTQRDKSE